MSKFELYQAGAGYRWRLKANNGEVVADSQDYTTKGAAQKGCEAVLRAASEADIVDV